MKKIRKIKKNICCFTMVCALTIVSFGSTVYASTMTSVSGKISTGTVTGSLVMTDSYATAITSFAWGGGTRYATSYVYYWFGNSYYYTNKTDSSSRSGGVSVTATKQLGGSEVVGAKGVHKLVYDAYTWSGNTKLGTIPSGAVYLKEA